MSRKDDTDESESSPSFAGPVCSFTDAKGRSIEIRAGDFPHDALVDMYSGFASEYRAQGLPPATEDRIAEWLDFLEEGLNVVAWDVNAEPAEQPESETAKPAEQPESEKAEPAEQPESETAKPGNQSGQERAVGHAALLSCGDGRYELTIFIHQEYQLAGIGSRLIRTLLGYGQEHGVERVWLTVQRSNHVAMNLYRSVGFETTNATGVEHEMELDL